MLAARFHSAIAEISPPAWNRLFRGNNPFIRHQFLLALEDSGCASADTGWQPRHLVLYEDDEAVAAMPLYLKSHSYGEFVFDWGWAEAYERHGLEYYPKLLTAIPFTPSTGPRLGFRKGEDEGRLMGGLLEAVRKEALRLECSGWHLLFPEPQLAGRLRERAGSDLLLRRDVNFRWLNRNYRDFDGFLAGFRSARRKNIRRERRLIREQGVEIKRLVGDEIGAAEWAAFFDCYRITYLKRSGHHGYLNREFFDRLLSGLREQLLLVVASRDDRIVASSLFLFDDERLYGRYWGALADVKCLHFEACLYQGIEFCIANRLSRFDPGTQGEHKLLRGFEPHETCSCHWVADQQFSAAIAGFLQREARNVRTYGAQAARLLPFKLKG